MESRIRKRDRDKKETIPFDRLNMRQCVTTGWRSGFCSLRVYKACRNIPLNWQRTLSYVDFWMLTPLDVQKKLVNVPRSLCTNYELSALKGVLMLFINWEFGNVGILADHRTLQLTGSLSKRGESVCLLTDIPYKCTFLWSLLLNLLDWMYYLWGRA